MFSLTAWSASVDKAVEENITHALQRIIPDVEITGIRATPIENLYEVMLGPDVIYISGDGRFVFRGDLLDLQEKRNLSEDQRSLVRKEVFSKLPAKEYIEFAPEKTKHIIYVFTDVDCSFCRRLHKDVPVLNENGVAVRYLAFPRGGVGTHAFNVMQAVWCSADRNQALTDAKNGIPIKANQCTNPVEKHFLLGQKFGIRGTPAIYLEDGQELPGYTPPDELLRLVGK
ncbi:MAG: DsbC family protein [Gammaproteobacteria bacterium]|nr:DsbC family protein [Gammaproteobacteria bacterium]